MNYTFLANTQGICDFPLGHARGIEASQLIFIQWTTVGGNSAPDPIQLYGGAHGHYGENGLKRGQSTDVYRLLVRPVAFTRCLTRQGVVDVQYDAAFLYRFNEYRIAVGDADCPILHTFWFTNPPLPVYHGGKVGTGLLSREHTPSLPIGTNERGIVCQDANIGQSNDRASTKEALKRKGYSKTKSAKIANAGKRAARKGGRKSGRKRGRKR